MLTIEMNTTLITIIRVIIFLNVRFERSLERSFSFLIPTKAVKILLNHIYLL